jgi:hypothetical protein
MSTERIEYWMMDEVKRFLEGAIMESSVEYFPRGNGNAVMFRVDGRPSHLSARKLMYQLWIDRSFFIRYQDRISLKGALESADVVTTMKKLGDKILELH